MSLDNVRQVETLSIQENLGDLLLGQVDSVFRLMISVPDLRHKVVLILLRLGICNFQNFWHYHLFRIESFSMYI